MVTENGWWTISADALLAALRRCESGESASLVYTEHYVNSIIERPGEPVEFPDMPSPAETVRRRNALEDLAQVFALAVDAVVLNQGAGMRAITAEQFRQDLRALGVTRQELDAVGIKP